MRIVGLDVGTTDIKLVEIDSSFGRYEIHDHREIPVGPGQEGIKVAGEILRGLPQPPHRLVMALRASQLTTRNLQLPTRDRKAIQSAVAFELEDELPFAIEDSALDSVILAQVGQQSQVHVATTLKKIFIPHLEKIREAGIDPDVLTTDSWAFRTLLNRTLPPSSQEKPILVAHIGDKSTLFYIHWRGFPMLGREIPWGGSDLSKALAQKLSISQEQARNLFKNPSMLHDSHPEGLIPLITDSLEELRKELRHMDLVCKGICHEPVQRILISGGSSLIPGLPEWLEGSTKISVERLRSLSLLSPSGVSFSEVADAKMAIAAGLAMSQVGNDRSICINFRKGEFSKTERGRELNLSTLRTPIIGAAVAGLTFFVSMGAQTTIYQKQFEEKDAQLKKAISAFFGSASQSALRTYMANPQSLQNSLKKDLEKNRELARVFGPNPKSPLKYLKTLSENIPKDIVVDVMKFQIGAAPDAGFDPQKPSVLTLSLISADSNSAEKLSKILIPQLIEVEKGNEKPTLEEIPAAAGKPKRVRLTWTGKVPAALSDRGGF